MPLDAIELRLRWSAHARRLNLGHDARLRADARLRTMFERVLAAVHAQHCIVAILEGRLLDSERRRRVECSLWFRIKTRHEFADIATDGNDRTDLHSDLRLQCIDAFPIQR